VKKYFDALTEAIWHDHQCRSSFVGVVPVKESFGGKTAWEGEVVVFDLLGDARAKRCYAWGHEDGGEWEITTVLGIPPVVSPETAVKVAIASKAKSQCRG